MQIIARFKERCAVGAPVPPRSADNHYIICVVCCASFLLLLCGCRYCRRTRCTCPPSASCSTNQTHIRCSFGRPPATHILLVWSSAVYTHTCVARLGSMHPYMVSNWIYWICAGASKTLFFVRVSLGTIGSGLICRMVSNAWYCGLLFVRVSCRMVLTLTLS